MNLKKSLASSSSDLSRARCENKLCQVHGRGHTATAFLRRAVSSLWGVTEASRKRQGLAGPWKVGRNRTYMVGHAFWGEHVQWQRKGKWRVFWGGSEALAGGSMHDRGSVHKQRSALPQARPCAACQAHADHRATPESKTLSVLNLTAPAVPPRIRKTGEPLILPFCVDWRFGGWSWGVSDSF